MLFGNIEVNKHPHTKRMNSEVSEMWDVRRQDFLILMEMSNASTKCLHSHTFFNDSNTF
jgi:hypothetical protein